MLVFGMFVFSSNAFAQPLVDENLSLIKEFILSDNACCPPNILKINDDGLFVVSYMIPDRQTSIIKTIHIDDSGMNYNEIDMIDFRSGGISSTLEKLGNDRYLLWGNGLYTVTISDTGVIGELSEKFSIYRGHGGDFPQPIVSLDDDTFLIAHQYRATITDFPGLIEVFHIADNGNLSRISELTFESEFGVNPSPVKIDSNTIAIAYQDRNGNKLSTFDISDLTNIQLIQSTSGGKLPLSPIDTLIHVINDVYAFQTSRGGDQIQTIAIDNDGIIGNIIQSDSLSNSVGTPVIINFSDDLHVTAYRNYPNYVLQLVSITDDSISVQNTQTSFGTTGVQYSNPIYAMSPLNDRTLVVLFTDTNSNTLNLFTYDVSKPPTDPISIEHYLSYKAKQPKGDDKFVKFTVELSDTFETGPTTYTVEKPDRLYNPVQKTHDGVTTDITDEISHYVGYKIKELKGTEKFEDIKGVSVTDQFGELTIDIKKPKLLLVPSLKDHDVTPEMTSPFTVNHFKCYDVKETEHSPKFEKRTVDLLDQFAVEPFTMEVKKLKMLCIPVYKTHDGILTEITNGDDNLTCYDVKKLKDTDKFEKRNVFTNNQFGPEELNVDKQEEMCVPSKILP